MKRKVLTGVIVTVLMCSAFVLGYWYGTMRERERWSDLIHQWEEKDKPKVQGVR